MNNAKSIKPLNLYPQSRMSEEQTQAIMNLTLNPEVGAEVYDEGVKLRDFAIMVGKKRAEVLEINIDKSAMVFICGVLAKNPATIVMYLHAVYQWQIRNYGKQFGITEMCYLFANGFPSESVLRDAWDAQKDANGHNLIDMAEVFKAPYQA